MTKKDLIIPTKKFVHKKIQGRITMDGKFVCWGGISAEIDSFNKKVQLSALLALHRLH